jgi:hypothetical protein
VTIDGVTPSNPLGLRKGYHIEYGNTAITNGYHWYHY